MRRRNPEDTLTLAALAGAAAWWWWHRTRAPQLDPATVATVAQAAAAPFQNQFTDTFGLHCKFPQTLQGRDSILGCYDPGANGPLGSSWSKEFRAANPLMTLPDSYPVF